MQLIVKVQGAIVDTKVFQVIIQSAIASSKNAVLPNNRHVSSIKIVESESTSDKFL